MLNFINRYNNKEQAKDYTQAELNNIGLYGPFFKFRKNGDIRCCILGNNSLYNTSLRVGNYYLMRNTGKNITTNLYNNQTISLDPNTIYYFNINSQKGEKGTRGSEVAHKEAATCGVGSIVKGTESTSGKGGDGGTGIYISFDNGIYFGLGGGGGGSAAIRTSPGNGGAGVNVSFSISGVNSFSVIFVSGGAGGADRGIYSTGDIDASGGGGGGLGGIGGVVQDIDEKYDGFYGSSGDTYNDIKVGGYGGCAGDTEPDNSYGTSGAQDGGDGGIVTNYTGVYQGTKAYNDLAFCSFSYIF